MKKPCIFTGVATALVTPFKDGEVDYPTLGRLIEMQIASGVSALVIGGTTGEAATLSRVERFSLYEFAKERVNSRVGLIFGVGSPDTAESVSYAARATAIGCDGVLAVTPYYNKGTEEGVTQHYLKIAEASGAPVILYNVPSRTGVNLTLAQLERLSRHPNVAAIKEASDSADRLVSIAAIGDGLRLIAGNDSQLYTVLALGGDGVISVVSNLFPSRLVRICDDFFSGRIGESRSRQLSILPLVNAMFMETNPTPVKYAMSALGLCSPEMRLPLAEATAQTKSRIDAILEEYATAQEV